MYYKGRNIYNIYIYIHPRSEPSMRAAGRAKRTQAETRHRLQVQEAQSPVTLLPSSNVSEKVTTNSDKTLNIYYIIGNTEIPLPKNITS